MVFKHYGRFRRFMLSISQVFKFIIIWVITLLTVVSGTMPVLSQFSLPQTETATNQIPPGVSHFGNIEVTSVRSPYLREELFEIASPTVWDRTPPYEEGNLPVEVRADLIESNLQRAISRLTHPETVAVSIAILNGATILRAKDQNTSRPVYLLTVTDLDAEYYSQTRLELAQSWQEILENTISQSLELDQNLVEHLVSAFQIVVGMMVVSVLLWWLHGLLQRRRQVLKAREKQQAEAIFQDESESLEDQSAPTPTNTDITASAQENTSFTSREKYSERDAEEITSERWVQMRSRFLATLNAHLTLQRRLEINRFLLWTVFWLQVLVIYLGVIWITIVLPRLTPFRNWLLGAPFELLFVIFGASLAIRISRGLIHRFTSNLQRYRFISFGEAQRHLLRLSTIAGVIEGVVTVLILGVATLSILNFAKVPTSSILAGSAIIGFAISFGAQSLVKDLINGCLILLEDQFAVGDVIDLGSASGLVENLNLRITQLRDPEGRLISIPNSAISEVKNLTRLWSRVDFSIVVAYDNDPEKVRSLLHDIAFGLYNEPQWQTMMPEPPEVLGIDHLSHEGMLWRVWIKTAPLQQWNVGREFRYRVRVTFEEHQIQIGRPQWISYRAELSKVSNNGK
jgi:small conductance mechanosensitive channel